MTLLLVLLVLPYATFVFFSESLNPLKKPTGAAAVRSRWRFARKMAMSVFLGVLCTLLLSLFTDMRELLTWIIGGAVACLLGSVYVLKKFKHNQER
ncbi:MAG: hypothetical protein ACSHXK_16980 [Oceanococcus sp.]